MAIYLAQFPLHQILGLPIELGHTSLEADDPEHGLSQPFHSVGLGNGLLQKVPSDTLRNSRLGLQELFNPPDACLRW